MDLHKSLLKYSKNNINRLQTVYNWEINLKGAPPTITLNTNNNLYQQNIDLRFALHQLLLKAKTFEEKYNIIKWYICGWGEIGGNKKETLEEYTNLSPEDLIKARGISGIASWSKALAIINPNRYAIYDARVSSSLNSLQIIDRVNNPIYYPTLSSRNSIIKASNIARTSIKKEWLKHKNSSIYSHYLQLLKSIASEMGNGVSHHDIEMLLFANAEELVKQSSY